MSLRNEVLRCEEPAAVVVDENAREGIDIGVDKDGPYKSDHYRY